MNRIKKIVFITVIFICMAAARAAANASEEISASSNSTAFDRLIVLANKQKSLEAGEQYWWRVFEKLDKISDDQLKACVSIKSDPAAMYQYVLEIGTGGAIEAVHWETSDEFTKCIDGVLIGIEFPAPPVSTFYFYLSDI